jgi:hypothetical protein
VPKSDTGESAFGLFKILRLADSDLTLPNFQRKLAAQ